MLCMPYTLRALCMLRRLIHFGYYKYNNSINGMDRKMEACIKPERDIVIAPNLANAPDIAMK